ncbi:DNA-directed RNA polymerase [Stenotrophomonas muris]|uniref:DNA-directed RNA polymerase n=1 Tax=Stenotrophomonas muris TaxID=2963283 RepID=UPI00405578BD
MNIQSNLQSLRDRQETLEAESVTLGQKAYNDMRADTPESEMLPGVRLLKKAVEPTAARIVEFIEEAGNGKAGRKHMALPYVCQLDEYEAAYLAARGALDGATAKKRTVQSVALNIGRSVEAHLNISKLADEKKGLYKKVADQLKSVNNARHRSKVYSVVCSRYGAQAVTWDDQEMLNLGMKLLELFIEATGMVKLERVSRGTHDTVVEVQFEESWLAVIEKAHDQCALLCPQYQPMVHPPMPWRNAYEGGYLTKFLPTQLVATSNKDYMTELGGLDLSDVLESINAVQATAWQINKPVYEVLKAIVDAEENSPCMPPAHDEPMPPRPYGIPADLAKEHMTLDQQEELKVFKGKCARIHEKNAKRVSQRAQVAKALSVAGKFADDAAIYFPHYLDFRGRVYPFSAYLSPQGSDLSKGLLRFSEGKALGDTGAYWLAVHIANCFGVDKVSFEDRVQWVMENEEQILDSGMDPLDGARFWETADSKVCALAACMEWVGYKLQGEAYVSHLAIAMDGSCSGLQHFSALLRDPVGGKAVNLVPQDKPGDIYTAVYKEAQIISDSRAGEEKYAEFAAAWAGKFKRSISKHPTMTLCYSATKLGMAKMILKAVEEEQEDGSTYLNNDVDLYKACVYAADCIWIALGKVVVAARGAMEWLQHSSKVVAKANLPMRWTTPMGLPVMQAYKEEKGTRVKVFVNGQRVELTLNAETSVIDSRRQAAGIAPNYVHSLDGAHLMRTAKLASLNGITALAVIHDSFGTHAADTDMLHAVIREALVQQYTPNRLEMFRDEVVSHLTMVAPELVEELAPLPPMGTLELEGIRESDYLFA